MGKKFILIALTIIFIFQFVALGSSFKLALFGDDWLAFWRLWANSDPLVGFNYNPVRYFLTPYGPQDMNMGFLSMFFGYYSPPYYIVSFLWRLTVSFALFFVALKLFNNKLAALFAGIFFAVSEIGLETTDWVFNMTSYTGLLFYVIFIYCFFSSRQKISIKLILLSAIFLTLAIITVPIRMHGGLLLIIVAETIWIIFDRKGVSLKYSLLRIATFSLTVMLIKIIGGSLGDTNEAISRVTNGFSIIASHLKIGQPEILLYPIMTFGYMIFPQILWPQLGLVPVSYFPFNVFILFIFILLFLLLTPRESRKGKRFFGIIIIGIIYNIIIWLMFNNHIQDFYSPHRIGSALLGGYITILLINLLVNKPFGKEVLYSSVISFWPYAFILYPWITLDTESVFQENHRYMIMSAAGIALIWAFLASLKINRKILVFLFALHVSIQLYATHIYLDYRVQRRSREVSEKIWSAVEKDLPYFDGKKLYVVFFQTDNQDMNYFNGYFGFPPRIALRDKIRGYRAPVAAVDYNQLISAVTDGKTLKYNGHEERPISPDQTITFLISGEKLNSIKIQNITEQTRKDLAVISERYLKTHPGVSYQQ